MKDISAFNTTDSQAVHVNKGTTLTEVIMWMVIAAVLMGAVYALSKGAFSSADNSKEISAYNDMMAKTPMLLKNGGQYNFSSASQMTGTFIVMNGGQPVGLNLVGEAASGTASLTNTFGGAVTLEPATSDGGQKSGFTLTTEGIPQEACTNIVTTLSSASNVSTTKVNGTTTSGPVSSAQAATQCTADTGSTGNNTLAFTSVS